MAPKTGAAASIPGNPAVIAQAAAQPSSPTSAVNLLLLLAVIYAHYAIASYLGLSLDKLAISIPEPWSQLVKFFGCSAVLMVVKAPVIDWLCSMVLGYNEQQAHSMHFSADQYQLLATLLCSWGLIFQSDAYLASGATAVGVVGFGLFAWLFTAACWGMYYATQQPPSQTTDRDVLAASRTADSSQLASENPEA